MTDMCEWCAVRGHSFHECMRRAPLQADENCSAISQLNSRVDSLQKSVDGLSGLT